MTYSVHSIFKTIQGEGVYMGRPAVFVRFTGCNVWSGDPATRERDTAKGCCAAWCDTEFRTSHLGENGGRKYTGHDLVLKVREVWNGRITPQPMVVFTGGEPSLQVTRELTKELQTEYFYVAMETNGSKNVSGLCLQWLTLSPKPPMPVVEQHYDEVKCVYPAGFDPEDYAKYANVRWIQPLDVDHMNLSRRPTSENTSRCIDYVLDHPRWRLGLQAHKHVGVA